MGNRQQGNNIQGRSYKVTGNIQVTPQGIKWDDGALPKDQYQHLQEDINAGRFCMVSDDNNRLFQFVPLGTEGSTLTT